MKEPVAILTNPKMADAVIKWFQLDFQTNISWFTYNGISWVYAKTVAGVNGDGLTYPKIYNPDYSQTPAKLDSFDIEPDSNQNAYGFFRVVDAITGNENDQLIYNLDFIVWGNLTKVDSTKQYDFTDELIKEVKDRLNAMYPLNDIDLSSIRIYTNPEDVFTGYTFITQEKTQYTMKPYFCFRINFDVYDICGAGGMGCPSGGGVCEGVDILNVDTGALIQHVADGGSYSVEILTSIIDTIDSNTSTIIDPL